MTESQTRFIKYVEDYYRDTYPATMRAKIADVLPTTPAALSALYETLIHSVSAQYRTAPDVLAIEKAMKETAEAYPELSEPQLYPPKRLMIEDNGVITETNWVEIIERGIQEKKQEQQGVNVDEATTQDAG